MAAPVISTVAPASGPLGTLITITGTGFGAQQGGGSASLNGVVAALAVISWSDTQIVAGITSVATSGNVVVTPAGTVPSNPFPFAIMGPILSTAQPANTQSSQPTITYRELGPNNDPIWPSFLSDIYAVAQAIKTKLLLFEGEWWESITEGTPWWQSILGVSGGNNVDAISLLLQQRILQTPYVTGLSSIEASYDPATRSYTFIAVAQTQFGPVQISSGPEVSPQTLPS